MSITEEVKKEVTEIEEHESKVVATLIVELQKAEAAVRSYIGHILTLHGHDVTKVALSQDLKTVVPIEHPKAE